MTVLGPGAKGDPENPAASAAPAELEEATREELYTKAQEADVEGRSDMTKSELKQAVKKAAREDRI